jgi:hypothetical protein
LPLCHLVLLFVVAQFVDPLHTATDAESWALAAQVAMSLRELASALRQDATRTRGVGPREALHAAVIPHAAAQAAHTASDLPQSTHAAFELASSAHAATDPHEAEQPVHAALGLRQQAHAAAVLGPAVHAARGPPGVASGLLPADTPGPLSPWPEPIAEWSLAGSFWARDASAFKAGGVHQPAAVRYWIDTLIPAAKLAPQAAEQVRNWLQDGVRVPQFFRSFDGVVKGRRLRGTQPPPVFHRNHPILPEHVDFVSGKIQEYLRSGAVRKVSARPRMVHSLGVVTSASKPKGRLVLDCRPLNAFAPSPPLRYESLSTFKQGVREHDLLFSLDHHAGYLHINLHPESYGYFGFQWQHDYFEFCTLPFGFSCACFIYDTLSGIVAAYLRTFGLTVIHYIDDEGVAVSSTLPPPMQRAVVAANAAVAYLAGFTISPEKSLFDPVPAIHLLGFIVDAARQCFEVPQAKLQAIWDFLDTLSVGAAMPLNAIQRWVGKAQSLALAVPAVALCLRTAHTAIAEAVRTGQAFPMVHLSAEVVADLLLLRNLQAWSRTSRWRQEHHRRLETDAAQRRWGGVLYDPSGRQYHATDQFPEHQMSAHISVKEAWAVSYSLQAMGDLIPSRCHLDIYVDNTTVQGAVPKGSAREARLREQTRWILEYELARDASVQFLRISTYDNVISDALSRVGWADPNAVERRAHVRYQQILSRALALPREYGEYQLAPEWFTQLQRVTGLHFTIDACATPWNTQCARFYARERYPRYTGCVGVDVFACSYDSGDCWFCNPPFVIIGQLWNHLRQVGAFGALLFPDDPKRHWFGTLVREALSVRQLIPAGQCAVAPSRWPLPRVVPTPLQHALMVATFDFRRDTLPGAA